MDGILGGDWPARYRDLCRRLPGIVARSRLTLCGMSACVDARIEMHDMVPLLEARDPPEAAALASLLKNRAAGSVGGEVRLDWDDGPAWLRAHVKVRFALGGTGPHAAWVLSTLGAPTAVALEDRSARMLACLPDTLMIAEDLGLRHGRDATVRGEARPEIFIFEYTAGLPVGDVVPTRSSRIIVRFNDPGLEHDPAFDRLSRERAGTAGAGLVAGFQCVPPALLDDEVERVGALARDWRRAGLATVHCELAGYDNWSVCADVLERLAGAVTSVGMSHSEFLLLATDPDLGRGMQALGETFGLDRVTVHADHWAASATRNDPTLEVDALMMGCLVASARADAGHPVVPREIAPGAAFHVPPFPVPVCKGGWTLVSCPSPYRAAPSTTLGLGDSFTGGCLMVLGQELAATLIR